MNPSSASIAVIAVILCGCTRAETVREVSCPAFAHVDLTALPTHLYNDPADESFDAVWTQWSKQQPDIVWSGRGVEATIRFETADGMVPHRARREVAARRSSEGWEVYARSSSFADPFMTWTPWTPAKVPADVAGRLDTLLADPCLWSAPRYLDGLVRLKNGRYDSRPDGPTTLYDVSAGERRWGGMQVSWTVGVPGQLRGTLLAEAFGIPAPSLDEIGPDGWIDQP